MRNFILFIALLCVSLFADDDLFGSGLISSKKGGISSHGFGDLRNVTPAFLPRVVGRNAGSP